MSRQNILRFTVLIFGTVFLNTVHLQAQEMQSLYFMRLPQANLMNPANQHFCNFYLDLPVVGSTNTSFQNSSLAFSDLVFPGTGVYSDSLITILHPGYNIDDFLAKLSKKNYLAPSVQTNLFSLGFRVKNLYFHLNISEKASVYLGYPKDLMTLIFKGNNAFVGNEADFSAFDLNASLYSSYSLGVSDRITDNLVVGVRGKFLSGIANLSLKNNNMSMAVDGNDFSHKLQADLSLNVSAPIQMITDSTGNVTDMQLKDGYDQASQIIHYLLNPANPGFAFDFGAEYKINDRFSLSASVLDLGMIHWKRDVNNLVSRGTFTFNGLDASPVFNINDSTTMEDVANNLLDSLKNIFKPSLENNPYTTYLTPKVYIGGTFNVSKNFYLGLLSRTEIHQSNVIQSFTVSANASLARFLNATVSYSYSNNAFNNIGAGLSLRGGPFQLYVLTDYVMGFVYPDNTHAVNVWLGLNLTMGCKPHGLDDAPLVW